jgi:hypothetical protein
VISIEDATEPKTVDGRPTVQVKYRYKLLDVPVWAKADEVKHAFPELAKAIGGENEGMDALVQTMAGWQRPE